MTRHQHDFYETAPWQTRALLSHQPITGLILEPCCGDSSIVRILRDDARARHDAQTIILTNDINTRREAMFHYDAASAELYLKLEGLGLVIDWVVTNPPYSMPLCTQIVERALRHARKGVAMNLRISFREPTAKVNPRGPFLCTHPISRLLTMPRYSYTGDGKSDSVTTEWAIWIKEKANNVGDPILSLYKADIMYSTDKELEIHNLSEAEQKDATIIYVPTETNLPILEASRVRPSNRSEAKD